MRFVLIFLALSLPCLAQTQGNAPQPEDSYLMAGYMNGGTGSCGSYGCVNFAEGVNNNDLVVCAASQDPISCGGSGANPPWTFNDTASFTWTMETASQPGVGDPYMQMGYACATSSQSTYRVNWPQNNGATCNDIDMTCVRFKNVCSGGSVTVDAFNQNSQTVSASGVTTMANSITTSRTLDLIVSAGSKAMGNGGSNTLLAGQGLNWATNGAGFSSLAWGIGTTYGSNSLPWYDYDSIHNQDQSMLLAFRVPIVLGDSALPQAGNGIAYSAQLHCYGANSATPTYALIGGSLPSGITLNTSTGVISGTTTVVGTTSPQFTCTDGTSTSPTDTLSLQVGALGSIQQLNTQQLNFNNGGATFTASGAACGDVITIFSNGVDTHGSATYLQTINGANNYVKSSDGSPVNQYFFNGGNLPGPLVEWVIGPLLTTNPTISVANSTSASSGLIAWASVMRGAQASLDNASVNSAVGTANGSISASYTTVVPNEFLQVGTISSYNTETMTMSSPFALDATADAVFNSWAFGHSLVAGASTVTATTNISNSQVGTCNSFAFCHGWTTLVSALRPGFDSNCAAFGGAGEKQRRPIW